MSEASAKRERALHIREAALGFNDAIAHTLIDLAETLEREAAELEAREAREKPE